MLRIPATLRSPVYPALLSLAFLLLLLVSSCCSSARKTGAQSDSLSLCPSAASKVDDEVRRAASQLVADDRGEELIPVLVQVKGPEAREQLQAAGMSVESLVGNVASGKIPARALADVAALDTVIQVQKAHELEIH